MSDLGRRLAARDEYSSLPAHVPAVDDTKLSSYASGTARKSKYQREKEAAELKRRQEEEDAARAYAEFVDSLEGDTSARGPVRTREKPMDFVRAGDDTKVPPKQSQGQSPATTTRGGPPQTLQSFADEEDPVDDVPTSKVPVNQKKRHMDSFLEELKRDQAVREAKYGPKATASSSISALAAYDGRMGSYDRGDPETTNIHVANLPANISEHTLGQFFAQCGPIGSIKIMWPRGANLESGASAGEGMTAVRKANMTGLNGFVAFMHRRDAERALNDMDGFEWGNSVLRCGWGKAVPLPARPIYIDDERSRQRSRSRSPVRRRSRTPPSRSRRDSSYDRGRSSRRRSTSYSPDRDYEHTSRKRRRSRDRSVSSRSSGRSISPPPRDRRRSRRYSTSRSPSPFPDILPNERKLIKAVASKVKDNGSKFEEMLQTREKDNPRFAFLVDEKLPAHQYFRTLIDPSYRPVIPFEDEGPASIHSTDSAESSEQHRMRRKDVLGKLARARISTMLRGLTVSREKIARCMAFAIERGEAAEEVAELIIRSLLIPSTPVPRKIARLYVISDILHNSSAGIHHSWKYRQAFEKRLKEVFVHFNAVYRSFPGRMQAEKFRVQVTDVLGAWENGLVFVPSILMDFNRYLAYGDVSTTAQAKTVGEASKRAAELADSGRLSDQKIEEGNEDDASAGMAFRPIGMGNGTGFAPIGTKSEKTEEEDVDGKPMEEDVDGKPMEEDVDGKPMDDDVDGKPKDDEIDGQPIEEDVDGVPMD